jgi:predicted nucleic acid-binding protein
VTVPGGALPPIHIDTSFLLRALQPQTAASAQLAAWIGEGRDVHMSAMAWTEFLCGPLTDAQRDGVRRLLGDALPILARHGERAAQLFNASGRRRGSLADCLIAAVAIDAEAPLATTDASFARFDAHGLQMV